MKNQKIVIGYQVEIKPAGEKFYTDYMGFYFTKEQAKKQFDLLILLQGEKARIKTIYAI